MKSLHKYHDNLHKLLLVIGTLTYGSYIIIDASVSGCHSSPKTHIKAHVCGVAMAVRQFKGDYGHLPQNWESLEGKNWRQKIYFSADRANLEGNEIHIIYDTDGDNIIKFQGHTIYDSVAVWSMYEEEMITSWEK